MKREAANSEKVSVNFMPMELGQIDALVEQGYYSDRSDLIRTAVRAELSRRKGDLDAILNDVASREIMSSLVSDDGRISMMGVLTLGKKELEAYQNKGIKLFIKVIGVFNLEKDVTPQLAKDTIETVKVWGKVRASDEVKNAIGVK